MTHRGRLTAVSGATAGFLLAVVFAGIVQQTRASDFRAMDEVLRPALSQAAAEVRASPSKPDLQEIAAPNPSLTLEAFDRQGRSIARTGRIFVTPTTPSGKQQLGGIDAVVLRTEVNGDAVIACLPWAAQEQSLYRLAILLAAVWAPLTALAAAATWMASQATFAPLNRLAREAAAMGRRHLAERLVIDGSDEYSSFAEQLNAFLERLEQSVAMQERFIGDAAHELRTPLTVLRGKIETTLLQVRSVPEYQDTLRGLLAETERLSSIVEMLLQSAASVNDNTAPTDLAQGIESAHARWVDRFMAQGVRLDTELQELDAVISEPEIATLLDNLLSNALRVSPSGSRCRIELRREDSSAVIVVEDDGPGIPPELADRVFDRFVRGDESRNRQFGGFGIGLSVCRRLVESRHGTIHLEQHEGRGTRFVIKLPVARAVE